VLYVSYIICVFCAMHCKFAVFVATQGCHSLSTLDCRRVVAPSMLTDPSQHSKHQKERVLCSWWPAPPSIFADDLVVSSRCQTVLSLVVTLLRDVGIGGQEQPDPYTWRGQKESVCSDLLLHLWTAAVKGWRLPRSWQIHTKGCRVFDYGSSYERPPFLYISFQ